MGYSELDARLPGRDIPQLSSWVSGTVPGLARAPSAERKRIEARLNFWEAELPKCLQLRSLPPSLSAPPPSGPPRSGLE
ncbi:UNVERIFIED_CONTAM: hypothetical protein K2H54_057930 [Gekko kuhli]